MNKKQILYFFILFSSVSESAAEVLPDNSINFVIGLKDMESEHWPPYGQQNEFGVEIILRRKKYPFVIVFGFFSAKAEFNYFGTEKSSTNEFNIGLRYEFKNPDKNVSFLETGISHIKGKVVLEGLDRNPDKNFNESASGAWVAAGYAWFRELKTEQGFKLKISTAKTETPSGAEVNLGGVHYIFYSGLHF